MSALKKYVLFPRTYTCNGVTKYATALELSQHYGVSLAECQIAGEEWLSTASAREIARKTKGLQELRVPSEWEEERQDEEEFDPE